MQMSCLCHVLSPKRGIRMWLNIHNLVINYFFLLSLFLEQKNKKQLFSKRMPDYYKHHRLRTCYYPLMIDCFR